MSDGSITLGKGSAVIRFECGDLVTIERPGIYDHMKALSFINECFDVWDPIRMGVEDAKAGKKVEISTDQVKKILQSAVHKIEPLLKLLAEITGNQVTDARFKQRGEKAMTLGDLANVIKALWELAELGKYLGQAQNMLPGQTRNEKVETLPSQKPGSSSGTSSGQSMAQSQGKR